MNYTEGEFADRRECTIEQLGVQKGSEMALGWHQMPDFAAMDHKKFHSYDLVLCAQPGALTASDPVGFLGSVHELLRPGGLLIIGTQYDWAPAAFNSTATSGEQVLTALLSKWFDPVLEPQDLEFVKAETSRKFECGTQHLTFWQRRDTPQTEDVAHSVSAATEKPTSVTTQEKTGQGMYDDNAVVGPYLEFHFGPGSAYPAACAKQCIEVMREVGQPLRKALEVGGGPGGAAIELSKAFDHVQSGDYSQTFVDLAKRLVNEGELKWKVLQDRTGGTEVERSVSASDLGIGNVSFSWLDAHDLPNEQYDLVCGFNLIDRLEKPTVFLKSVNARLNQGGVLVLASPYTWLEEFTPKDNWLGGFKYGDNDGLSTYLGMKELLLAEGFEEIKEPTDLWFRIDSLANGRASQQTCAQMTFWRKL